MRDNRDTVRRVPVHFQTVAVLLLCGARAFALNPALEISQYAHFAWKNSDGFAKGSITSIAQTPDGYLWLGTDFGLLRFDGFRPVPWTPPAGERLPSDNILALLVSRDGTLWIGTTAGLVSWKDGKLTRFAELDGTFVDALLQDREGTIWVAGANTPTGYLCAVRAGVLKCDSQAGRFASGVHSLYENRGDLWLGTSDSLWRWDPGPPQRFPLPDIAHDLIEADNGALWIATGEGIQQFADGKIQANPLAGLNPSHPFRFLRDRDGGLWIGTVRGLFHLYRGRIDRFASSDGLSHDGVSSLFEDREGNIWVGTEDGLDRFHEFAVSTLTAKQGLSGAHVGAIVADGDGNVWLGGSEGLDRWRNGQMTVYRSGGASPSGAGALRPDVREIVAGGLPAGLPESLFRDDRGRVWVTTDHGIAYYEEDGFVPVRPGPNLMVHSVALDGAGGLWINDQNLGLLHAIDSKWMGPIPWVRLGSGDLAPTMVADPRQGGLWLGFFRGGVSYFQDGAIRTSYQAADGLAAGRVYDLRLDGNGALWVAADGGVSRIQNGRIATLTQANGLPSDVSQWTMEDDSGALWLNTPSGLVSIARPEWEAWGADPRRRVRVRVFDSSDGVRSYAVIGGFTPHVAKLTDGTLWFANVGGVGIIDPRHIPFNNLPPPVSIEQIVANGKSYPAESGTLRLPKLIHDLQIDYTALSFVAPEKNRFRYKLEGHDAEWIEAGTRRQAFYNDLGPRSYRFRVQACNNSGVWNEAGDTLEFSIAPAYYQTTWFRALCVAAFVALLAALYWLRLQQVARHFNIRLEERVGERTRIARDLHDTLLQSFQGVLLKFHAVTYLIPDRPEAQKKLDAAIEEARQAIAEGRDAVQGLRSSAVITEDIARAVTTFGEGLVAGADGHHVPLFQVHVEGAPRDLAPVVRDEIYRIAGEGLRNAFHHSGARRIEVDIHYDKRQLCLRVRDDGKGIDRHVLDAGSRAGHHGLPGMQERAALVGGKLTVWSELNSGTEIELTISAAIAYAKSPAARHADQSA